MNNKRGFTLVELLGVIAVLGFLLILIVPKVKDLYNVSKKDSFYNSAKGLVSTLEEYYVRAKLKGDFSGCEYNFNTGVSDCIDFNFDGKPPSEGIVFLSKDGYVNGYVNFENYVFEIKNNYVFWDDLSVAPNTVFAFDFSGAREEMVIERSGYYKLEVWGVQGGIGGFSEQAVAGRGGYSSGVIYLNSFDKLYIYVGGTGTGQISNISGNNVNLGGFNGGGNNYNTSGQASSGGGASDIRINNDSLYSRVIVAGGGGGNGFGSDSAVGGAGGGLNGFDGTGYSSWNKIGKGGTQGAGGINSSSAGNQGFVSSPGTFGQGGIGVGNSHGGGSGGGGFYGGGGGAVAGGGGGSGFVYTESSYNNWLSLNESDASKYLLSSDYYLLDAKMIDGNSSMPNYDNTLTMVGNSGNGYVKITFLGMEY